MINEKPDLCIYCGSTNECKEHVIPVAFLGLIRSYNQSNNWIVPSCERCNTLAGSEVFFSIPKKAEYLIKRYRQRHKKEINMPEWSQDEIDELEYKFREMIYAGLTAKRVLINKLDFLKSISKMPDDYLRPDFIEKEIEELIEEQKKIIKQNKLKKKKHGK